MAEVEVRSIQKSYGKRQILKEVSFSAGLGTCTGILGANGSGKSTLLSILAGVQRPDQGEFILEGTDLFRSPKLRASRVGYVPQGTPLLQELTALDNLSLWYDKEQLQYQLEDGFLAMLGIGDFLKTPVYKMSGGMKKRLSIGCAIASEPKVLLLDEPCAALDLVCKERILNYFRELRSQGGVLLLATHDVQELELCDQCFLLKDGILSPYSYDGNVHRLVGCL
jgi:ABC-2 type transport system ATP-binding protein